MRTTSPVSTDELHTLIRRVCMYLGDDEQADFESTYLNDVFKTDHKFTAEQKGHIFYVVHRLEQYLEQP